MIFKFFFRILFFLFILLSNVNAEQNIVTINLDKIFQNSNDFSNFLKVLQKTKNDFDNKFQIRESELIRKKQNIEDSNDILNDKEIQKLISDYTLEVNNFSDEVNEYNNKIDILIENNKNEILDNILIILKDISIKNNYDIVLSQDNYFIASDNLDISQIIIEKLNLTKIELKTDLE